MFLDFFPKSPRSRVKRPHLETKVWAFFASIRRALGVGPVLSVFQSATLERLLNVADHTRGLLPGLAPALIYGVGNLSAGRDGTNGDSNLCNEEEADEDTEHQDNAAVVCGDSQKAENRDNDDETPENDESWSLKTIRQGALRSLVPDGAHLSEYSPQKSSR